MEKGKLIEYISNELQDQLDELELTILNLKDEIANETKSSAGDKFETSREMMNQERIHLEERKAIFIEQLYLVKKVSSANHVSNKVENGSLIKIGPFHFLIVCPIGKIEMNKKNIQVVSPSSPIAKSIMSKKINDHVMIGKSEFSIEQIS